MGVVTATVGVVTATVSSLQLAGLVRGHYDSMVGEFQIIDSRYPYEFYGGHIKVATSVW